MNEKKKNFKSFSLIEVLIALLVLVIALSGTSALLIRTMSDVSIITSKLIAANLAQEGIEIVRNIRDNNIANGTAWNSGLSAGTYIIDYTDNSLASCSGNNCKVKLSFDPKAKLYSYKTGGSSSIYSRWINIEQISSNHIRVTSNVEWKIKSITFDFSAEDHLYNY